VLDLGRRSSGGGEVSLSARHRVVRRYRHLVIDQGRRAGVAYAAALRVPGVTLLPGPHLRVTVEKARGFRKSPPATPGSLPAVAYLDAGAVGRSPLVLRSGRPGDRIRPLGMKGTRKVQDILVDSKVPQEERGVVPVLACGEEIVWLAGYRVARGWQVPGPSATSLRVKVEHS
jgi:tRNA(Ile)-lysidine synthase